MEVFIADCATSIFWFSTWQSVTCVFWLAGFLQAKAEGHHQQVLITSNVCSWIAISHEHLRCFSLWSNTNTYPALHRCEAYTAMKRLFFTAVKRHFTQMLTLPFSAVKRHLARKVARLFAAAQHPLKQIVTSSVYTKTCTTLDFRYCKR